jgi:hypothetical protein
MKRRRDANAVNVAKWYCWFHYAEEADTLRKKNSPLFASSLWRAAASSALRRSSAGGNQLRSDQSLPGRFHPQIRDQNRRDMGKSQSIWTDSKMKTPGSPAAPRRALCDLEHNPWEPASRRRLCRRGLQGGATTAILLLGDARCQLLSGLAVLEELVLWCHRRPTPHHRPSQQRAPRHTTHHAGGLARITELAAHGMYILTKSHAQHQNIQSTG